MVMKPSSTLTGRKPLDRQGAWSCLTSNLALPGLGSLLGRRVAGYFQATLCVLGVVLTFTFGIRFAVWYFTNWARFNDAQADPLTLLNELWINVRWALLGIALFAFSWLWALATSLTLLRRAKAVEQTEPDNVPPQLTKSPHEM